MPPCTSSLNSIGVDRYKARRDILLAGVVETDLLTPRLRLPKPSSGKRPAASDLFASPTIMVDVRSSDSRALCKLKNRNLTGIAVC